MAATTLSRDSIVLKPVQDNVNLSSSSSITTTKRLTRVEKARLEALAAFGNESFDSLSVKTTDLGSKLKLSAAINTENKPTITRALTRMEKAKIEANNAFKNVKLGQMINNPRKRKMQERNEGENVKKQISLTRIQKARQEVQKAFENVSLDKIPPKRSKLEMEKMEKKLLEGKKESKKSEVMKASGFKSPFPGSRPVSKSSRASEKVAKVKTIGVDAPIRRLTRSESAKMEALKCANGVEGSWDGTLNKKNIDTKSTKNAEEKSMDSPGVAMETAHKNVSNITPQCYQDDSIIKGLGKNNGEKRLTRLEKAKLEALQSFEGQEFSDICKKSTRIVSKYLKPNKKDLSCDTENEECWSTPKSVPKLHNQEELKCQESFHLKSAVLKLGSEMPKTKPIAHQQLKQKRPKVDVFSSIIEENFKDQSSLLETSRRVVKTAIELETPEGSPMSATTS